MLKRAGTELLDTFDTQSATVQNPVIDARLLVWRDNVLVFYSVEVAGTQTLTIDRYSKISGGVLQTLTVTPWARTGLPNMLRVLTDMKWAVNETGVIIFHEDFEPQLITQAGIGAISFTSVSFSNIPQFDFNDASSPLPTAAVWTVDLPSNISGDTCRASIDGIQSEAFPISSVDTETAANMQLAFQQVLNNFTLGEILVVNTVPGLTFQITFSGSAADDYDSVNLVPEITSAAPTSTNPVNTVTGVSRKEDVWSATRGWPRTGVFHENRLVLAGSKSRTQTVWASRTAEYFDFKNYRSLDNEAIDITLDVDGSEAIVNVFSERNLIVFTQSGEHICPNIPVTPINVAFPQQSRHGSQIYTDVLGVDNNVIFAQTPTNPLGVPLAPIFNETNSGGAVRSIRFNNDQKAYDSSPLSLAAESLMNEPHRFANAKNFTAYSSI